MSLKFCQRLFGTDCVIKSWKYVLSWLSMSSSSCPRGSSVHGLGLGFGFRVGV